MIKFPFSYASIFFLSASILSACTINTSDLHDSAAVYTDTNFRGSKEEWVGRFDVCHNVPDSMNDRVSSLTCDGQVTVYENENCDGASYRFTCNVADLHASNWGDRISSIRY